MAVAQGALADLPSGPIAVFRPGAEHDLSDLAEFETEIITGFFTDFDFFQGCGYSTRAEPAENYAGAVVFLPRAKVLARHLISVAMAVTDGGPVVVDGQKTDGIESTLKAAKAMGGAVHGVNSKNHGKVFTLEGGDFSSWASGEAVKTAGGYWTAPGVFSADGIDPGSAALAAALPDNLAGKVADLGAGWGFLSEHILKRSKVTECHLIEAEHLALECARKNIPDPRARFHWADAIGFQAEFQFDHIVTNPPFHTSRAANPDLGRGFITAASHLLRPGGTLWLVANRHLPYEQTLLAEFKDVKQVGATSAFKVFQATSSSAKPTKSVRRNRR